MVITRCGSQLFMDLSILHWKCVFLVFKHVMWKIGVQCCLNWKPVCYCTVLINESATNFCWHRCFICVKFEFRICFVAVRPLRKHQMFFLSNGKFICQRHIVCTLCRLCLQTQELLYQTQHCSNNSNLFQNYNIHTDSLHAVKCFKHISQWHNLLNFFSQAV